MNYRFGDVVRGRVDDYVIMVIGPNDEYIEGYHCIVLDNDSKSSYPPGSTKGWWQLNPDLVEVISIGGPS